MTKSHWNLHTALTTILKVSIALLPGLTITSNVQAEWDDWITDAYVGIEQVTNISHAISGSPYPDEDKNDALINPRLVYGRIFQAADNTRLIFTAKLDGKAHQEYSRLNATTLGGAAVLFHKFGYGIYTPWLRANLDLGYTDAGSNLRDSSLVNAGLRTGMRFLPWLDGWIAYEYFRRDGKDGDALPAGYSGITYVPSVGTDVFDLVRNTFRVNLNIHPVRDVTVTAGYSYASGDFTAACSDASFAWLIQYETSYKAVAVDGAFEDDAGKDFCVYRVAATANTATLGASYALGRSSSVNVGYQQQKTEAKVYSYETKVYHLNYLYTF